jgi:hypothetical protein
MVENRARHPTSRMEKGKKNHLSVFDDRQLVTGLPGAMFEGLQHTQTLTVNAKRLTVYTGLGPRNRVTAFTSSRRVAFCVVLIGMIVRVIRGAPNLSLYRGESKNAQLVLVGYNRRVLVLLHNLAFLVRRLG